MILALLLLLAVSARAQDLAYDVEITGIEDGTLKDSVAEVSRLLSLKDRPPSSLAGLRRRAEEDRDRIQQVLRANGYYDGSVDALIDEEAEPAKVVLTILPGSVYPLAAYIIRTSPAEITVPLDVLGLEPGQPARSAEIVAADAKLLAELARRSYPLAHIRGRRALVDHTSRSVRVEVSVETGPYARFGPAIITGLERVAESIPRNRLPWREGEPFDPRQLDKARRKLAETGLFAAIKLSPAEQAEADGRLPIRVELRERPHRSV
ncbi:MAG: hypothetical protein K2Q10_09060, partial [Rhodospirillales bacterium]|nr:hypothetical protein [Rhodospirillales bacterium]